MANSGKLSLRSAAARIGAVLLCAALGGFACGGEAFGRVDADAMRAGVAAALREPKTLARTAGLVEILQQLDAANVAGAAAAFDAQLSVLDDEDLRLFLHAWSAFDPAAALDHTQAWTMLSKRELGAGQVIYAWARYGAALEARLNADSLAEPSVRRVAHAELVRGWARSGDTDGVTTYVSELPHGDLRDRYTATLVAALVANEGVEGAVRWVESIPDDAHDRFKRTAFRKALRHVTARDPQAAARWYERHAATFYANLGMSVVATEWVERDPQATFAWLVAQPAGADRDMGVRFAMNRWLALDAPAAEAWMRGNEPVGALAPALEPFAIWLAKRDPAEAVRWSERIPDDTKRARMLVLTGTRWRRQDAPAFEAWLAEAELPDAVRRALEGAPGATAAGAARLAPEEEGGE